MSPPVAVFEPELDGAFEAEVVGDALVEARRMCDRSAVLRGSVLPSPELDHWTALMP
jgi:hypothetical protein